MAGRCKCLTRVVSARNRTFNLLLARQSRIGTSRKISELPLSWPTRNFRMNSRQSAERPSHPFSPNISNLWIIGVAAVVLAVPMLGYGPMPQGHDTDEHLNFARY